jgi:hypothetical protein
MEAPHLPHGSRVRPARFAQRPDEANHSIDLAKVED